MHSQTEWHSPVVLDPDDTSDRLGLIPRCIAPRAAAIAEIAVTVLLVVSIVHIVFLVITPLVADGIFVAIAPSPTFAICTAESSIRVNTAVEFTIRLKRDICIATCADVPSVREQETLDLEVTKSLASFVTSASSTA